MKSKSPDYGEAGFRNILFRGRPVERDLSLKTDYLVIARNRLHRWWLINIRRYSANKVIYQPDLKGEFNIKVSLEDSMPLSAQGRVTKSSTPPDFDLSGKVHGGQVRRTMPRQLRKLKEAQEARTDDMSGM